MTTAIAPHTPPVPPAPPRPRAPYVPPPGSDRALVIMSDIEMGAGGQHDDFPHSDWLGELILSYNEPPFAELAVDLVFNGDTFDLFKTAYMDAYPRHITADVSLAKLSLIAAAHPRFFEAVRRFLAHGHAPRRVYFVTGNHDAELLFPSVMQLVRSLCGGGPEVFFPGYELTIGAVLIEHGHQHDAMFRMDPERPFVRFNEQELLNISWGAAAMLDTIMHLQPIMPFHDRLKPREKVFAYLPEAKEFLTGLMWQYWSRDYWKGFFSADPTKKLTWTMIKELVYRFSSKDTEVAMDLGLQQRLRGSDEVRLVVLGHLHQPGLWSHGDRKLIQNGCLRNEYMMFDEGRGLRPIPKTYVEAFLREGQPLVSRLCELQAPPPPHGYVPESIYEIVPLLKQLLQPASEHEARERAAQEAKEAQA